MKLLATLAVLTALLALAIPVSDARIDVCGDSGDCLADLGLVDGCHVNGGFVRADLPVDGCTAQVYTCSFESYMGGAGGDNVWRNFEFQCVALL